MKGLKIAGVLLLFIATAVVIPCVLIATIFKLFDSPGDWLLITAVVVIDFVWIRLWMRDVF